MVDDLHNHCYILKVITDMTPSMEPLTDHGFTYFIKPIFAGAWVFCHDHNIMKHCFPIILSH